MHAVISIYDGHALLLCALYFLSRNDYRRCLIFNAAYSLFIELFMIGVCYIHSRGSAIIIVMNLFAQEFSWDVRNPGVMNFHSHT